jgi:hypothetical protein
MSNANDARPIIWTGGASQTQRYREQLASAVQATSLDGPTTYSWFGDRVPPPPAHIRRALSPRTARAYLLFALQAHLYRDFYCHGVALPAPRLPWYGALVGGALGATPFQRLLSAANAGHGCREVGHTIRAVAEGRALVDRDGLEVWAQLEDYEPVEGEALMPGAQVVLRLPKELLGASPGYYLALGDAPLESVARPTSDGAPDAASRIVRVYWHLMASGAVPFLRRATRALNAAGLPFRLKVLNDPDAFTRCDAAVLYLRRRDYIACAEALRRIYHATASTLRPSVPAFTKPLVPGVGLAEGPAGGESFGLHRCLLVAEGMLRAHEAGRTALEERLDIVASCLATAGVRPDAPFLDPGAIDTYEPFGDEAVRAAARTPRRSGGRARRADQIARTHLADLVAPFAHPSGAGSLASGADRSAAFRASATDAAQAWVEVADAIGRRLVREAIWCDERCTWLGADPLWRPPDRPGGRARLAGGQPILAALGPGLYAGTSGVALFLAELSAATGDGEQRRAALGATRHALSRAASIPGREAAGLYTGLVGIAVAAARAGLLLGEPALMERAADLCQSLSRERGSRGGPDVISGQAGAIIGLLVLRALLDDASLLWLATALGDDLIASADRSEAGYSWRVGAIRCSRNLTGLSHGAAGIGSALLELHRATGETRFRLAAERGFDYERHWFDGVAGNWPDFRSVAGERVRRRTAPTFACAWCHGAPGIALTRLRAYTLLGDPTCRAEAVAALRTTRAAMTLDLRTGTGNYSLCHGLAGNAEALLYGHEVLGKALGAGLEEVPGDEDEGAMELTIARRVAVAGSAEHPDGALPWRCGAGAGEAPGLMQGLAGIGHFYLRLAHPATPSVLLFQPERWLSARLAPRHTAHGGFALRALLDASGQRSP